MVFIVFFKKLCGIERTVRVIGTLWEQFAAFRQSRLF